ncbi:DinB family protein [Flammeovirgaceae bacterium SG7u.111]|nr:DinB family protein [Flammeovirgaceae bacterium SG7u.132]WPO36988.1 DinB family protein [Flammeovirgaceae bacterium SG7u.111]
MTQSELIILNFTEIRRKSIILWNGLPESHYDWRPDKNAMSAIEMIRHVLEADYGWNIIVNQGDMTNYKSPWENRPFVSVDDELGFAKPYRERFLESVRRFSKEELDTIKIIHPGNGKEKVLGKYLLRIGYHESIHAGQFLSYLRTMGIKRPEIWD